MTTSPPTQRRVRIARKQQEAHDICSFELVANDGQTLPGFSAGSHIDVHLPGGLVRQYSLCNDARESHRYLIAVLREPASRGGSLAMHAMQEGQELAISEPRNHFALAHDAQHHLLLAGGIGVTPVLCMAERLAAVGASFEMHYCARSQERAAFLTRIASSAFASQVALHFDDGDARQKLDLAGAVAAPTPGKHLYVCGPAGFMDAVLGAARAAGWAEGALHREYFAAAAPAGQASGAFDIKLASSGRVIHVAADQTAVAALAAAGVDVAVSCEQGVCGTCVTRVLEGTPDHRDVYLTAEEQARCDQFTPCCSRATSACLVLDL